MIQNQGSLNEIRESWAGVEILRQKIGGWTAIGGLSIGSVQLMRIAHNLPFLNACSVLNDVLEQLKDEGKVKCKGRTLKLLLVTAANDLPWIDYALMEECAKKRNDLAHRGELIGHEECAKFIDSIETQLVAWGILDVDRQKPVVTTTVSRTRFCLTALISQ